MAAMTRPYPKPAASRWKRYRGRIQALFLLVWLLPLAGALHNVCGPVFHCYACPLSTFACPIGVLANFSALHVFPFFAVGMLLAVGGTVGGFICGWVCPFGYLQDLFGRIPTPRLRLPAWTGYTRYVVLIALVIVVPYLGGENHPLHICKLCPAGGVEVAAPQMAASALAGEPVVWPNATKTTIVILFIAAMFFTYRPWCSLFCPLGAIFGAMNRVSAFFLRFTPEKCISCKACRRMCKYGIEPDRRAGDPRCIRCLECTDCPTAALDVGNAFEK
jgi:polyferredoxin